jgi:hypothetical protein
MPDREALPVGAVERTGGTHGILALPLVTCVVVGGETTGCGGLSPGGQRCSGSCGTMRATPQCSQSDFVPASSLAACNGLSHEGHWKSIFIERICGLDR